MDARALLKACANGSSEFMSNISTSLISVIYNLQLLKFAGENSVAAYGTIMYAQFIFVAVFIEYISFSFILSGVNILLFLILNRKEISLHTGGLTSDL